MSKVKENFKKLIEAKGWIVTDIIWEPISHGRDGRDGGWYISVRQEDEDCDLDDEFFPLLGYNKDEVLRKINAMPINNPS